MPKDDQSELDQFNRGMSQLSDKTCDMLVDHINKSVGNIKKTDDEYEIPSFGVIWRLDANKKMTAIVTITLKGGQLKNPGMFGSLLNKKPLLPIVAYVVIDYTYNDKPTDAKSQLGLIRVDLDTNRAEIEDASELSIIIVSKLLSTYISILKKAKKSLDRKFNSNRS